MDARKKHVSSASLTKEKTKPHYRICIKNYAPVNFALTILHIFWTKGFLLRKNCSNFSDEFFAVRRHS